MGWKRFNLNSDMQSDMSEGELLKKMLARLEASIENPSEGLPEDIFLFITGITPMINVDLLIKNRHRHTLLTWRDDGYYPASWHIPGGIIRYKETIEDRIHAVAANELGAGISFECAPLAVNQVIHPSRRARGHFISLLYGCSLTRPPRAELRYPGGDPEPGQWAWHDRCPDNLIPVHAIYRKYIGNTP